VAISGNALNIASLVSYVPRPLHLRSSYAEAKERHRWGIGGVKEAKGKGKGKSDDWDFSNWE